MGVENLHLQDEVTTFSDKRMHLWQLLQTERRADPSRSEERGEQTMIQLVLTVQTHTLSAKPSTERSTEPIQLRAILYRTIEGQTKLPPPLLLDTACLCPLVVVA